MKYCSTLKRVLFILLIYTVRATLSTVESQLGSDFDDSFLDGSFGDDIINEENMMTDTETVDTINEQESEGKNSKNELTNKDRKSRSYSIIKFNASDVFTSRVPNDYSSINEHQRFFVLPWQNELLLNNYIQYKNSARWFEFLTNYNLYFSSLGLEGHEFSFDNTVSSIDTKFQYELIEANTGVRVFNGTTALRVGKIYRRRGVSHLINPSNPLSKTYGYRQNFANNLMIDDISTDKQYDNDVEIGSGTEVGYWGLEFELALFSMTGRLSYLPKFETGFFEFDRPTHGLLAEFIVNRWDWITPALLWYWYGKHYMGGANTSIGGGDYLTINIEAAIHFQNELLVFRESSRATYDLFEVAASPIIFQEYELSAYDENGQSIYPSAILGLVYTPQIQTISIATIFFEVYYNGKGLWPDEWDEQVTMRGDINDVADMSSDLSFPLNEREASYEGILNRYRYYYSPLDVRPLYMFLKVSRDDILGSVWKQNLNAGSDIVYSMLDTSFSWDMMMEVETQELFTIGANTRYYFGLPNGAFTELSEKLYISIYTKIRI